MFNLEGKRIHGRIVGRMNRGNATHGRHPCQVNVLAMALLATRLFWFPGPDIARGAYKKRFWCHLSFTLTHNNELTLTSPRCSVGDPSEPQYRRYHSHWDGESPDGRRSVLILAFTHMEHRRLAKTFMESYRTVMSGWIDS